MSTILQTKCNVDGCTKIPQPYNRICSMHKWRFKKYGEYNPDCLKKLELHGKSGTPTYHIWEGLIDRCYNKNRRKYYLYGGKGIKVCDRWRHSFKNFLKDMGEKPHGMTLDRINSNGDYCKENCRWATYTVQNQNVKRRDGYKGINKNKYGNYVVEISYDKNRFYIGYYEDEEWAAYMYDQWAIALYGDGVSTNFEYK